MVFQQIQPPEALQNHVRYFWTLEGTCPASLTKTFATIADGCPGFVFQQSDHGMFYDGGMALPETFLYGQTTQYREIATTGRFRLLGAYLWPNALKSVFGLPADELTDGCLDLQLLPDRDGFQLPEQLSETADAHRPVPLAGGGCSLICVRCYRGNCPGQYPPEQRPERL